MAAFRLWDTPFSTRYPPTGTMVVDGSGLLFTVAPGGVDVYPQYRVQFEDPIGFKLEDESYVSDAPEGVFPPDGVSCYELVNSEWLRSFKGFEQVVVTHFGHPLRHFVVLGGDWTVQVITPDPPLIETVRTPPGDLPSDSAI